MKSISRRSFIAGGTSAAALVALGACGTSGTKSNDGSSSGNTHKIGVLQLTEHAALDAANKGFIAALDESGISYTADQQNAQNDQSACVTAASKFVGDADDLIFAIATPAAQAVSAATKDMPNPIPIVGTAITDYALSGLVDSNDKPGRNLTGTSDMNPVDKQMDMLKKVVPTAKQVGLLFCTSEANSGIQIEMAEAALDKLGISHTRYSVSSSNEIQSVTESMVGKVDAIYTPTDNTIVAGMAQVGQIAKEAKIPIIAGEENACKAGGLCTLSIDYTTLGHMAGEMAVKILEDGTKPADMPIEHEAEDQLKVIKNEDMAKALGINLDSLTA